MIAPKILTGGASGSSMTLEIGSMLRTAPKVLLTV